jgi:hypothetical protein
MAKKITKGYAGTNEKSASNVLKTRVGIIPDNCVVLFKAISDSRKDYR